MDKVTISLGSDNQWYWHRTAVNGEVVSNGEGYTRKHSALVGAARANPDVDVTAFVVEGEPE